MGNYKSDFLNAITERGFLHQCTDTDALDDRASSEVVSAYIGFDCTAPSLHVGSLLPVMLLRWLQRTGHKPIVLMGGGTTKVGDPSGKDESRLLLTEEKINENMDGIKSVFSKYLIFGENRKIAICGKYFPIMVIRGKQTALLLEWFNHLPERQFFLGAVDVFSPNP